MILNESKLRLKYWRRPQGIQEPDPPSADFPHNWYVDVSLFLDRFQLVTLTILFPSLTTPCQGAASSMLQTLM